MNYEFLLSQFHYGSIKTIVRNFPAIKLKESQFHYGSIKTGGNVGSSPTHHSKVSIPLWFD